MSWLDPEKQLATHGWKSPGRAVLQEFGITVNQAVISLARSTMDLHEPIEVDGEFWCAWCGRYPSSRRRVPAPCKAYIASARTINEMRDQHGGME